MVKVLSAKALAVAVLAGGALLATGGTSFAAGTVPAGGSVTGTATDSQRGAARANAQSAAANQCAANNGVTGTWSDTQNSNGSWRSVYRGTCLGAPQGG
ncbi:hypothetical protein ACIOEX_05185 [Streptomyces sp. NPDC087850]|uniref:hypothetical protein n=1 Tax=Streptomyces sp. NPDC087850 TaxID=3365809 RepID=UPI0038010138